MSESFLSHSHFLAGQLIRLPLFLPLPLRLEFNLDQHPFFHMAYRLCITVRW
jgi:hypothetical protein